MLSYTRLSGLAAILAVAASPSPAQFESAPEVAAPQPEARPAAAAQWSRRDAQELLAYVGQVGDEGLDPADYDSDRLSAAIESGDERAMGAVASEIFLQLSSDLMLGHVRGDARVGWHMKDDDFSGHDQQALMAQALDRHSVRDTLVSLLPTHPQYTELKRLLASTTDQATRDRIRTNMDRWRWMPRDLGQRYVLVNVPAYTAAIVENGEVVSRHRTVVGATRTPTPQLSATAQAVTFNPWWTVPQSIIPELGAMRGYEVRRNGDTLIVRQPPGPRNSLGRMKIEMPNGYAIYLHDTPAKHLFSRDVRAFSHGCIRTQNALGFAASLLSQTDGWDRSAIDRAVATGETTRADLAAPVPVYIAYFTAAAGPDGLVSYRDIYGRDRRVVAALSGQPGNSQMASAE